MDRCSWCTTPCTVRRGRRPRRRWSRRTASCCCTTCTRSWCWCTRCRWTSWHRASGRVWRCGWLRKTQQWRVSSSPGVSRGAREHRDPTWPLAQAPVHRVDAGLRLQAAGRRLGQVAAEARVAGLARQPLQAGVGEGRHVLPAPVGHIDFPEPHPGRHGGLVLQTHTCKSVKTNTADGPRPVGRGISEGSAANRSARRGWNS